MKNERSKAAGEMDMRAAVEESQQIVAQTEQEAREEAGEVAQLEQELREAELAAAEKKESEERGKEIQREISEAAG